MTDETTAPTTDVPEGRSVAQAKRAPIIVQDALPVLDTGRFEQMQRIAGVMGAASLMPAHLRGPDPAATMANCFLVVNQAVRWGMDPFALAQHVFVLQGKLGYEGKVIAAVMNNSPKLDGSLRYEYSGEDDGRAITVSGKISGDDEPRTITGTFANWRTKNENWTKGTDQMLAYRGAREWGRRHMPEAMLGISADDDLEAEMRDITPPARPRRGDYSGEVIERPETTETVDADTGEVRDVVTADDPVPTPPPEFTLYGSDLVGYTYRDPNKWMSQYVAHHDMAMSGDGDLEQFISNNAETYDVVEALLPPKDDAP